MPPEVNAKTAQKHDYPSKEHRRSYARRTGAERTFSTTKDPASNNIAHGWTRLMGLTPITLWLACLLAVRNQRILTAWNARQLDGARRTAAGLPPKPGGGAATPSPASPPPQHRHNPGLTYPEAIASTRQITRPRHGEHNLLPGTATAARQPALNPGSAGKTPGAHEMSDPNVKISAGQT